MAKVREMGAQFTIEESQNFGEWQTFVESSAFGNIFQTSHWAMALIDSGQEPLLLVARDGRGVLKGGMLSIYNRYSFMKFNVIPSISSVGGPVAYDLYNNELLEMILGAFDAKARKLGALHSYIRSFFPLDRILVRHFNYSIEYDRLPCTVILDLSKSTEELWKDMSKRGRWGIRKAERAGVVVEEGGLEDLSAYYKTHVLTCKRLGIPSTPLRRFRSLWRNLSYRNNMNIFLAKYESKPVAGCIILRWCNKMWYFHSVSLEEYWHLNANHALQWHVIKWGKENGVGVYDFLGIPCKADKAHPKYGLYLFKTQFGGKIVRHGEYVKHYFRLRSALLKNLLPIYTRFTSLPRDR